MTVLQPGLAPGRWVAKALGPARQILIVIFMNVPTVLFGMSLSWVSLAAARGSEGGAALAGGAGATHAAGVLGVLAAGAALRGGRVRALAAASACFALCWGLKLVGGAAPLLAARVAAGLAGAAAWTAAPLLGREICGKSMSGAAAAAPVLAHNVGFVLMYAAADAGLPDPVILWSCLGVSLAHCVLFLLTPESPAFLAATHRHQRAASVLAWLRGEDMKTRSTDLEEEIAALPPPEDAGQNPFKVLKELWSDRARRRALVLSVTAVAGQECCGLLALMQFAEPLFQSAAGGAGEEGEGQGGSPARHALVLGLVQLVASALALIFIEKIGRRPLIVWTAVVCTGTLTAATGVAWAGGVGGDPRVLAGLLAAAVAADSLGMQPAPYALLSDMFSYQYRGCALLVATCFAAAGNALEVWVFAGAARGGAGGALALAAALTAAYTLFVILALPETRGRSLEDIYEEICPQRDGDKKTPLPESVTSQETECVVAVGGRDSERTQWTAL